MVMTSGSSATRGSPMSASARPARRRSSSVRPGSSTTRASEPRSPSSAAASRRRAASRTSRSSPESSAEGVVTPKEYSRYARRAQERDRDDPGDGAGEKVTPPGHHGDDGDGAGAQRRQRSGEERRGESHGGVGAAAHAHDDDRREHRRDREVDAQPLRISDGRPREGPDDRRDVPTQPQGDRKRDVEG